jgi:hypothetical protein
LWRSSCCSCSTLRGILSSCTGARSSFFRLFCTGAPSSLPVSYSCCSSIDSGSPWPVVDLLLTTFVVGLHSNSSLLCSTSSRLLRTTPAVVRSTPLVVLFIGHAMLPTAVGAALAIALWWQLSLPLRLLERPAPCTFFCTGVSTPMVLSLLVNLQSTPAHHGPLSIFFVSLSFGALSSFAVDSHGQLTSLATGFVVFSLHCRLSRRSISGAPSSLCTGVTDSLWCRLVVYLSTPASRSHRCRSLFIL